RRIGGGKSQGSGVGKLFGLLAGARSGGNGGRQSGARPGAELGAARPGDSPCTVREATLGGGKGTEKGAGSIARWFSLEENATTVGRELFAGLTTFMAMAYVVVVNPRILAEAGMPADGVLFATCLSAALATLVMGLGANYPIALAPGMSLNAYFTYSVVIGRHVPWPIALGVVFLSGVM